MSGEFDSFLTPIDSTVPFSFLVLYITKLRVCQSNYKLSLGLGQKNRSSIQKEIPLLVFIYPKSQLNIVSTL